MKRSVLLILAALAMFSNANVAQAINNEAVCGSYDYKMDPRCVGQ
jgi:hypothetical protein